MVLAVDVATIDGRLLVARGYPVREELVFRLLNLPSGMVREPLLVIETRPAGQEEPA